MFDTRKPSKSKLEFYAEARRLRRYIHEHPGICHTKLREEFKVQARSGIKPYRVWINFQTLIGFLTSKNYVRKELVLNDDGVTEASIYFSVPMGEDAHA